MWWRYRSFQTARLPWRAVNDCFNDYWQLDMCCSYFSCFCCMSAFMLFLLISKHFCFCWRFCDLATNILFLFIGKFTLFCCIVWKQKVQHRILFLSATIERLCCVLLWLFCNRWKHSEWQKCQRQQFFVVTDQCFWGNQYQVFLPTSVNSVYGNILLDEHLCAWGIINHLVEQLN